MPRKLFAFVLPLVLAASALPAVAANGVTEDEEPRDARLEGYPTQNASVDALVIKERSGSAGTWFMTVALGALCFGVMCKNGKRTHLD
ncbi:MAG: hypothetical protein QM754_15025 [Tepidisphaeraceae bacterium]